jgi:hypothetical protein
MQPTLSLQLSVDFVLQTHSQRQPVFVSPLLGQFTAVPASPFSFFFDEIVCEVARRERWHLLQSQTIRRPYG